MTLKPDINQIRELGHHATVYDWGIQFIGLPSAITGFTSSDLNTRCKTAQIPQKTINAIEISMRGHKVYQHGTMNYGNQLTLSLYETVDSKVANFLDAYMAMEWAPITGVQAPKSTNQCAFLLTLLNSQHEARKHYTIVGAWLQGYNAIELQSDSSSIIEYQTTWQFDYFI